MSINIPDNTTNGDVIKILFPDYICVENQTYTYVYVDEKHRQKGNYLVKYSTKWWNKLYKSKEET